jgi:2-phospho-L-lactate guanylyltransferase
MNRPDAIIIPFRSIADGKSRLAPVLDPVDRMDLSRSMLNNVVHAALGVRPAATVIVVTPDRDALTLLEEIGASHLLPLWQPPEVEGLNGALTQATTFALDQGARTVVILPADLPLLRSQDVENLVRRDAPVVIAPDRRRQGTNGLMQRIDATGGQFGYHFGVGSFHAHLEEAHRLGLDAAIAVSMGTSFDLDTPADLGDLKELQLNGIPAAGEPVAHG